MIPVLDRLPRKRRYVLGEKIETRVIAILEALVAAAWTRDKKVLLGQANRDLEVCRHLWRLCHDLQGISGKQYEHGSLLMLQGVEFRRIAGGHRNHPIRREPTSR